MLKKAFDREMKSESGFSFAMASQPFGFDKIWIEIWIWICRDMGFGQFT